MENQTPEVQNSSTVIVMNDLYYFKQTTLFLWASIFASKKESSSLPWSPIKSAESHLRSSPLHSALLWGPREVPDVEVCGRT